MRNARYRGKRMSEVEFRAYADREIGRPVFLCLALILSVRIEPRNVGIPPVDTGKIDGPKGPVGGKIHSGSELEIEFPGYWKPSTRGEGGVGGVKPRILEFVLDAGRIGAGK